ncbi:hypothetical protein ACJMK2_022350 [Sinanodonta woodiana]|uniref:Myeloid differentiation factor 88 n=1 Tax=Sinanodonta woodiana TaxID=1069815 RepID=A0ABD3TKH8_SINWO
MATDFALLEKYRELPLRFLRPSARSKLAQYLDLEGELIVDSQNRDIVNNYSGLAELIGFSHIEILNFMRNKRPTIELLQAWTMKDPNATLGKLWDYLYQMERLDVLTDCHKAVVIDAEKYFEQPEMGPYNFPIQVPEVSPSEANKDMAIDDIEGAVMDDIRYGTKTTYDAFVSYNEEPNDLKFVRRMIEELEVKNKLKLFIPGRDDIPGAAKYVVTAEMIEKRCRRVIIVISESFGKSTMCDFQVKFAQALSPGARSKRLIPVLIEKSPIPRILKFLSMCDFTKKDMEDWVWDRLSLAVQAPLPQPASQSQSDQSDTHSLGNIHLEISGIYSSFRDNRKSHNVKQLSRQPCSYSTSREKESESPPQTMQVEITRDYDSHQQRRNSNCVIQSTTQPFSPAVSAPNRFPDSSLQPGVFTTSHYQPEENSEPSTIGCQYASLSMETAHSGDRDETISSSEEVHFV